MKLISKTLISAGLVLASLTASAATVITSGFGDLAGTTFGGDNAAYTTAKFTVGAANLGSITLGLTAMARPGVGNGAVTDNDKGRFFAWVGADTFNGGDDGLYNQGLARWNFDYYIGSDTFLPFRYVLTIDTNRGPGVTPVDITLGNAVHPWNLGFDLVPGGTSFQPGLSGLYTFKLSAYEIGSNNLVASTSMEVQVVPEPATLALVGLALVGVGFASRRRKA